MERERKSSASGNCSSRVSSRVWRLCLTYRYGSVEQPRPSTAAVIGAFTRNGSMVPRTTPATPNRAIRVSSRVEDQVIPAC